MRGVCSFEHARATSVNVFPHRPMPALFKLPVDFFTYQVMAIDAGTLLLLTHVRAMGRPLMTTAHITGVGEDRSHSRRDIRFDRGKGGSLKVAPDGATTRVPERFWWTGVTGEERELKVETVLDTEMIYGIGRGWIGGLRFTGRYDGRPVEGRGYVEYIDRALRGSGR